MTSEGSVAQELAELRREISALRAEVARLNRGHPDECRAVTVEEAAELLLCGRLRVFELLAEGRLVRAPRFGRKVAVQLDSVLACLASGTGGEIARSAHRRAPRRSARATSPADLRAELRAAVKQATRAG